MGTGSSKKDSISIRNIQGYSTRTLYSFEVTDILKATGNNEINRRMRQIINIRGCAIKMHVRNNTTSPMYFNYALVSPKNANQMSTDGFFRDHSPSRDVNFDAKLTGIEFNYLPINTDKYAVLGHHRKLIQVGPGGNTGWYPRTGINYNYMTRYFKINRQVTYNDDTGSDAENKIFWVFWFDAPLAAANSLPFTGPQGQGGLGALDAEVMINTYFREPK